MIIPNNYAQANLRWGGAALPFGAETTLGLNVELYAGTPAEAAEDVALTFGATDIGDFITDQVTLVEVEVKFGPNATGPSGVYAYAAAMAGPSASSPPNVTWLVQKQTGFGGRTGRGRMYFPGVPEAYVGTDGIISSTYPPLFTTAMEAWRTALSSAGLVPSLLHGPDSPISSPMPITGFLCDGRAATQRNRLRR